MDTFGFQCVPVWGDVELDLFDQTIDEVISTSAARWAENRNSLNQLRGEDRAESELAFREAIVSGKSENVGKSGKYFWITVNPKTGTDLPTIIKLNELMHRKKWIQKYAYVYETTENNHIHVHSLISAEYEPKRAWKELSNSVKSICMISNPHCFVFRVLTEQEAKEKMRYMMGMKQDKKLDGVELTKTWRTQHDLKEVYFSEDPLTLLDPQESASTLEINI